MMGDDLDDRLDRLEARAGEDSDDVLVIGGDPERAGWMDWDEYEERYSEAEREDHVGGEEYREHKTESEQPGGSAGGESDG